MKTKLRELVHKLTMLCEQGKSNCEVRLRVIDEKVGSEKLFELNGVDLDNDIIMLNMDKSNWEEFFR